MNEEKKRRKRGGVRKYLKKILEELKNGLEPKKLDYRFSKNGIPHDTLYNIIRLLEEAKIIYKDDDSKYYYVWRKGIREFSKENYEIALNHSRQLLSEADAESGRRFFERLLGNKYFIQHLETGYPEVFNLYKEWESVKGEKKIKKEEFFSEVKRETIKMGFEIKDSLDVDVKGKEVYKHTFPESIWDSFEKNRMNINKLFEIKDDEIYFNDYIISSDPSAIQELRELIKKLLSSKKLEEIYNEYRELTIKESELYSELKKKIKLIVEKVKHGEPLRGYCDLCPLVIVKEVTKEKKD